MLKIRYKAGATERIIYKQKLSKMPDCWYLSGTNQTTMQTRFVYMKDLETR